jgi:hypothetical protein
MLTHIHIVGTFQRTCVLTHVQELKLLRGMPLLLLLVALPQSRQL